MKAMKANVIFTEKVMLIQPNKPISYKIQKVKVGRVNKLDQ